MLEKDRLLGLLRDAFDGDPWHGPPTASLLDGVSAAQAAGRPSPGAHSIWELVRHMTAWKLEVARRIDAGDARMPEMGDWPDAGPPTEANWRSALDDLRAAHERLIEAVSRFDEGKLDAMIGDLRDPPTAAGVTNYVTIQGILQHDAYHSGQIAMLKRIAAGR
jgi:uncharacterized damage-inducible protein DinB